MMPNQRKHFFNLIKKHLVVICLLISVILIFISTYLYPGGSLLDKNSIGFDWSGNFFSNLFDTKAINGSNNPGWLWALVGMAFHSVGYGLFFINMSKKISANPWAKTLKIIGVINIVLIFLIATPLHDIGTISIVSTLAGLFVITVFVLRSKLLLLKFCCVICLLTYYAFFMLYGFGNLEWTAILQKLYILCSVLLVIGLEYFTKYEDFLKNEADDSRIKAVSA